MQRAGIMTCTERFVGRDPSAPILVPFQNDQSELGEEATPATSVKEGREKMGAKGEWRQTNHSFLLSLPPSTFSVHCHLTQAQPLPKNKGYYFD